ncbi:MAG: hypothetical protein ACFB2W_00840 [Leptolyngbyaceae cyanobacterium]
MTNSTAGAELVAPLIPAPARTVFCHPGCGQSATTALLSIHLGVLDYDPDQPSPGVEHEFYVGLEVPLNVAHSWDRVKQWTEVQFSGFLFISYYNATGTTCPIGGYGDPF